MGLFFNLFVESGNNAEIKDGLVEYFKSIGKIETSFGIHEINIGNVENHIGITVSVHETGHTGLGNLEEQRIATQVGLKFYELLKNAPPFRCAVVGVEAGEWFDGQNISDPNFEGYLPKHGLVVNNELNVELHGEFVKFKNSYSWTAYQGEIKE